MFIFACDFSLFFYMTQTKYFFFLNLLLFSLVSCKDTNEYRVGSEFEVYVQRFETEALARGRSFDLKATGLIVEFADLKDNTAGLCHYEDPIRIEIDKTYWNAISKTAGADLMKEDLLFHELGHGLLGRKHLNDLLENGDWKSIMCGGDQVGDRPWNINYRGIRRAYYLDELFNESTPAPDFASTQLLVDTTGFIASYQKNFDSPDQSGWALVDNTKYKTSLVNGRLCFQSKVDSSYMVYATISNPISNLSDFSYESTLEYPSADQTNQYGILFGTIPGGSDGVNDPIEYFTLNNNLKMFMGNRTWYSYYTELSESSIVAAGSNKLKVFKIGKMLYYFINDVYCYQSEMETTTVFNQFGFMVPPKGTVYLDNFKISLNSAGSSSSKVKQNLQIEFKVLTTDKFDKNKVNNQ